MHILKSLKLLFNYYMPIYACAVVHVWSEDNWWYWLSLFIMCLLAMKLRPSGLAASTVSP